MNLCEVPQKYRDWKVYLYRLPRGIIRCPRCSMVPESVWVLVSPYVCSRDKIFFDPCLDAKLIQQSSRVAGDFYAGQISVLFQKYRNQFSSNLPEPPRKMALNEAAGAAGWQPEVLSRLGEICRTERKVRIYRKRKSKAVEYEGRSGYKNSGVRLTLSFRQGLSALKAISACDCRGNC